VGSCIPAIRRVSDLEEVNTMLSSRDQYVEKMKAQLDEWNAGIAALEEKGSEITEDAKVKYQEQLAALRAQRAEGEKKLEEMQAATESTWEQVKLESDNVWEAFKDSYQAFVAHFK
jgi:predicted  nucleic acid-binding Zn-ribbon protein